jgi:hypothetical protein
MVRTAKPHSVSRSHTSHTGCLKLTFQRESKDTYKRGNPDAPGAWKHDLHQNVKQSLASRLGGPAGASGSRPSLLDRISGGKGKELLPTNGSSSSAPHRLHGFGETTPVNLNNPNAGTELLPGPSKPRSRGPSGSKGRLVDTSLNAALGRTGPRRSNVRPLVAQGSQSGNELLGTHNGSSEVSIFGASRATTWVKVDNLAQGTTAEDVVSAFAPTPILNARISSSPDALLVAVDIEVEARATADEIVQKYNGVMADGNALSVTIIRQKLTERMGRGGAVSAPSQSRAAPQAYSQPRQELHPAAGGSR